jgi:predicted esterase
MIVRRASFSAFLAGFLLSAAGCGDDDAQGNALGKDAGAQGTTKDGGTGAAGGTDGGPIGSHNEGGPAKDKLPTAKGKCPTFDKDGDYTFDVLGGRQVLIWVDASQVKKSGAGGPVIFYWHGTGSSPQLEVPIGLGQSTLDAVKSEGGLVAGFYSAMNHSDKGKCDNCNGDNGNGVWFTDEFAIADEVLACAIEQLHIDTRRIHVSGMSAGGLQTTNMLYGRSNYLASAAPYSGGEFSLMTQVDESNHLPAMIFHGTYAKDVVILHFYATSKILFDDIQGRGGFAIDCNHGGGHMIPGDGGPGIWKFFQAHPYGTNPSPWAKELPAGLPPYCSITFTEEPDAGGPFG